MTAANRALVIAFALGALTTASCAQVKIKKPRPRTLRAGERVFLDAIVEGPVEGGVGSLSAVADAKRVAVGTLGLRAYVLDASKKTFRVVWKHDDTTGDDAIVDVEKEQTTLVAAAHDGRSVAVAYPGGAIELWDAKRESREHAPLAVKGKIRAIAWAPDGATLAVAVDKRIVLFTILGPSVEQAAELTGHKEVVTALAFSPNGARLASGGGDRVVKVWDIADGKLAKLDKTLPRQRDLVTAVAWSPDGKTIASGSIDSRLQLFDVESGTLSRDVVTYGPIVALAFSPDGATLASGGRLDETDSEYGGVLVLWNLTSLRPVELDVFGEYQEGLSKQRDMVRGVAFSPDGKNLYFGTAQGLTVWRFTSG